MNLFLNLFLLPRLIRTLHWLRAFSNDSWRIHRVHIGRTFYMANLFLPNAHFPFLFIWCVLYFLDHLVPFLNCIYSASAKNLMLHHHVITVRLLLRHKHSLLRLTVIIVALWHHLKLLLILLVEFCLFSDHAPNLFLWTDACPNSRRISLLGCLWGRQQLMIRRTALLLLYNRWVVMVTRIILFWVTGKNETALTASTLGRDNSIIMCSGGGAVGEKKKDLLLMRGVVVIRWLDFYCWYCPLF